MKRYLIAGGLVVSALLMQSCEWFRGNGGGASSEDEGPVYCTVEYSDSMTVIGATAYQSIHVDFPAEEDSSTVSQAVLSWLCDEIRTSCYPDYSGENQPSDLELTTSGDTFGEAYVNTYGRWGLDRMAEDIRDMAGNGYEGSFLNHLSIELVEQTEERLTFLEHYEVYTGGAHGGYMVSGATFRRSDGKRFGWEMFDHEKRAELVELMKKGLMAYFNQEAEEKIYTDSALFDHLILFDNPETPDNELEFGLPLPATEPWISNNGVEFIYQQYEIAAYACGMPCVTLPFDALKDILTPEGRKFVGLE